MCVGATSVLLNEQYEPMLHQLDWIGFVIFIDSISL
jgi:hypothetical protein